MTQPADGASLHRFETEQIRPELANLDQLSVQDLIDLMAVDVQRVPDALFEAKESISLAVSAIVARMERGGRLIYVGAGTAGRLGLLDAAEAGPTFNVTDGQVVGVLAGGTDAFSVPVEAAEDDYEGGQQAMTDLKISERDCVVGISASGRTPFVLGAIDAAERAGALRVGIACNSRTPLSASVEFPIDVVVGPELIAGSTRMNAGTAQKVVLNVISTAAMVRLGKTYGNLMVDMRPTNEKLRDRASRIVAAITGSSHEEALTALAHSHWRPKVAAVMLVGRTDADEADARLKENEGRLRPTLASFSPRVRSATPAAAGTRLGVAAILVEGVLVPGDVAVRDGKILAVGLSSPGTGTAIPGFVDAQVNGFAGVDLLNAQVDEIMDMGEALLAEGVVAYQPTLITAAFESTARAASRLAQARRHLADGAPGARILGTHLEGPFLSPQRSGTHPIAFLRGADVTLLDALLDLEGVTMMTLAPEIDRALSLIERARARDVVVALGHSAATADQATAGFDAGASAVTHLFNAMESISARRPGLAITALTRPSIAIPLIADGVHVDDRMIQMAFATAPRRCLLVSDMIAAAGFHGASVSLGDVSVTIRDGVARRDDGTIAGSVAPLHRGLRRLAALGVSRSDALNAVTWRPARLTHATGALDLRPGAAADLLVLDDDLVPERRFVAGREVALALSS